MGVKWDKINKVEEPETPEKALEEEKNISAEESSENFSVLKKKEKEKKSRILKKKKEKTPTVEEEIPSVLKKKPEEESKKEEIAKVNSEISVLKKEFKPEEPIKKEPVEKKSGISVLKKQAKTIESKKSEESILKKKDTKIADINEEEKSQENDEIKTEKEKIVKETEDISVLKQKPKETPEEPKISVLKKSEEPKETVTEETSSSVIKNNEVEEKIIKDQNNIKQSTEKEREEFWKTKVNKDLKKGIKDIEKTVTKEEIKPLFTNDEINIHISLDGIYFAIMRKGNVFLRGKFSYDKAYASSKDACSTKVLTENLTKFKMKYGIRKQKIKLLSRDDTYVIRIIEAKEKATHKEVLDSVKSPFLEYDVKYILRDKNAVCFIVNQEYLDHIGEVAQLTKSKIDKIAIRPVAASNGIIVQKDSEYKIVVFITDQDIIYGLYKERIVMFCVYKKLKEFNKVSDLEKDIRETVIFIEDNYLEGKKDKCNTCILAEQRYIFSEKLYTDPKFDIKYDVVDNGERKKIVDYFLEVI